MSKYIRLAVLLFVFGIAPVLTNAVSASVFEKSFATLVHTFYDMPGEESGMAAVSSADIIASEKVPEVQAETGGYYYDDNFKVTFSDVLEGFKGTFEAMTTLPR